MRRRFFVDRFDANSATLSGDAAEHLGRVLRAEPGQLCELSDGNSVWLGRVERVALPKRGEERIEFSLVEHIPAREPWLHLHLLIAIVKFDRFEWCLEKATRALGEDRLRIRAAIAATTAACFGWRARRRSPCVRVCRISGHAEDSFFRAARGEAAAGRASRRERVFGRARDWPGGRLDRRRNLERPRFRLHRNFARREYSSHRDCGPRRARNPPLCARDRVVVQARPLKPWKVGGYQR